LLPQGQFGVGIPSGVDFIMHTTMADLERHLNSDSPTRALLLLNIINMFNAVLREACRSMLEIHKQFCLLLPLFDMLCSANNNCWCCKPDGTFDAFERTKGFAQGCPLSPFLASLVPHILLADINTQLKQCATIRKENHAN
jgi:hypothetical protein